MKGLPDGINTLSGTGLSASVPVTGIKGTECSAEGIYFFWISMGLALRRATISANYPLLTWKRIGKLRDPLKKSSIILLLCSDFWTD